MFERLVGVETEYALRFHPGEPGGRRIANSVLFERMLQHIKSRMPVVRAIVQEYGWFLATGGGMRLERLPHLALLPSASTVEGATPECRRPRQLLLYQRAQDVFFSRAAAGAEDGEATPGTRHAQKGQIFSCSPYAGGNRG